MSVKDLCGDSAMVIDDTFVVVSMPSENTLYNRGYCAAAALTVACAPAHDDDIGYLTAHGRHEEISNVIGAYPTKIQL